MEQKKVIVEELKERGFRITKQRLIIINILATHECSSCKEIHYLAAKEEYKLNL